MLSNAHLSHLSAQIARIATLPKPPKLPKIAATKFFNQENAVFRYLDEVALLIIPAFPHFVIPAKAGIRGRKGLKLLKILTFFDIMIFLMNDSPNKNTPAIRPSGDIDISNQKLCK